MSLKYTISSVSSNFLCYKHTSKTVDKSFLRCCLLLTISFDWPAISSAQNRYISIAYKYCYNMGPLIYMLSYLVNRNDLLNKVKLLMDISSMENWGKTWFEISRPIPIRVVTKTMSLSGDIILLYSQCL